MKLILLFCTIILTTRHIAVAEEDTQDYVLKASLRSGEDSMTEEEPDSTPLHQLNRRQVRSDSTEIEARRRSSLDKNFMRFGRSDKNILRFGRSDKNILRFGRSNPQNILRFGRSGENFIRFGRNDGNFMRFGRNDDESSHMRLGRPDNNFIRFGRTLETINPTLNSAVRRKKAKDTPLDWSDGKRAENFIRFGRNQKTNFLRLGRAEDKSGAQPNPQNKNILRFGRAGSFIRFGRSDNGAGVNPESSEAEEVAENMKPILNILPSDSEDDLLVIPPNYLISKESDK
uniref:Uncharacterized protein n=1 Tax=Phlebotomus papatasi TaxID=29031 RepID=A0A1B0DPP3_PHLPP